MSICANRRLLILQNSSFQSRASVNNNLPSYTVSTDASRSTEPLIGRSQTPRSNKNEFFSKATNISIVERNPLSIQIIKGVSLLILLILFLVLISFSSIVLFYKWKTTISVKGQHVLSTTSLKSKGRVLLDRDSDSLLHIVVEEFNSKNPIQNLEYDLYFAHGFATAQERMFQMDFCRRKAQGNLAEIIPSIENIQSDKLMRTIGFYNLARREYNYLNSTVQMHLEAYSAGVNEFIETSHGLPIEFYILGYTPQKWNPIDSLAILKVFSFDIASNGNLELLRYNSLMRGMSKERTDTLFGSHSNGKSSVLQEEDLDWIPSQEQLPDMNYVPSNIDLRNTQTNPLNYESYLNEYIKQNIASSAFVVKGNISSKPFLAGDIQMTLQAPNPFLISHLQIKSSIQGRVLFNALGACFVGVPYLLIGRNDYISYSLSSVSLDTMDYYVLEETDDGVKYKNENGQWRDYELREEIIKVRNDESISLIVKTSSVGPVMNQLKLIEGENSLALNWIGFKLIDKSIELLYGMMTSTNYDTFTEQVSKRACSLVANYLYADVARNVGSVLVGTVPKKSHSGRYPVPLNTQTLWVSGTTFFDQIIQVKNPQLQNYIISSNQQFLPFSLLGIEDEFNRYSYRAVRIEQLLKQMLTTKNWNGLQSIYLDNISTLFTNDFRPILERMKSFSNSAVEEWRQNLLKWDGSMDSQRKEPTIFEFWLSTMQFLTSKELNITMPFSNIKFLLQAIEKQDISCTTVYETVAIKSCEEYVRFQFEATIISLQGMYAVIPNYGKLHQIEWNHIILQNYSSLLSCAACRKVKNVNGGTETVLNFAPSFPSFSTTFGTVLRYQFDLNDLDRSSYMMNPISQSGNIFSYQYDKLLESFLSVSHSSPTLWPSYTLVSTNGILLTSTQYESTSRLELL